MHDNVNSTRPTLSLVYSKVNTIVSMESPQERTFQYQDNLPPLPVPPLDQTLDKYLQSVKPLVKDEDYKKTEKLVKEFGDGSGRQLQQQLLEKAKHSRNWLEEWWLDTAYLIPRDSIAVSVNYSGPFPLCYDLWPAKYGTQMERSSMLIYAYGYQWNLLRNEVFPVVKAKAMGNKPMCMNQNYTVFNVCQVPGIHKDHLVSAFRTKSEGSCPGYVAVFINGHVFRLDIIDEDDEPITQPELYKQLLSIKSTCDSLPPGPGIGALTAWDRTSWAKARQHLIDIDADNLKTFNMIETSIMCISLDTQNTPTSGEQAATLAVGGHDVFNRWYDKTSLIVSYSTGLFASCANHTPVDAIVGVELFDRMQKMIRTVGNEWKAPAKPRVLAPSVKMTVTVDNKIMKCIQQSAEQYWKKANNIEIIMKYYTKYGKNLMKSFKIHPDVFVQLSLQLNYFKMHGKSVPTYESSTTRLFYHGRTETVRSCTMESVDWCKSMMDNTTTTTKKYTLLKHAAGKHSTLMAESIKGQGCDRHLLGLQILASHSGGPMPEIFLDKSWTKSGGNGNFVLSTSLAGYSTTQGIFAPMLNNGYGVAYNLLDDRIGISISAWKDNQETDAFKFYKTMLETLDEMAVFLTSSAKL